MPEVFLSYQALPGLLLFLLCYNYWNFVTVLLFMNSLLNKKSGLNKLGFKWQANLYNSCITDTYFLEKA